MAPRVLFTFPIIREEDQPKHFPLGMAICASVAERAGADVAFYDMNAARSVISRDQVFDEVQDVAREGYDIVATGGLTTTYSCVKRLGKLLRPILPDATFLLGGNLITTLPNEIMSWLPEFDICAVGDAWETMTDIVAHARDREWSKVMSLGWRNEDGDLVFNSLRPPIQNVDTLPFPAWHLIPMEVYFKNSAILLSETAWQAKKRLGIATSFGCPLRCLFCVNESMIGELSWKPSEKWKRDVDFSWKGKHVYHYHSPEYIIREIKTAEKLLWDVPPRGPIDYLDFADENFLTTHDISPNHDRIFQLRDAWLAAGFQPNCIKNGIEHSPDTCAGKHITATSHAGRVRPELLEAMKDMGVSVLDYGLESFNLENMRNMQKGSMPHLNIRAVRMTMSYGVRPCPNQILGFPTESFKSIRDNVAAWKELGVIVYPFMCTPFPGSAYFLMNRKRVGEQYGDDLELFVMDLGDCTKPTASICDFTVEELTKLREWMVKGERESIDRYENVWRRKRGLETLTLEKQDSEWRAAELRAADPRGKWPPEEAAVPLQVPYKPEHIKIRELAA